MNMGASRRRHPKLCMAEKTKTDQPSVENQLRAALKSLEQMSTRRDLDNLVRFGITATRPFGVSMANLKVLAKRVGPHHELAAALWNTDRRGAHAGHAHRRAGAVTPAQMERWCRDFDNWGICDTACFALADRARRTLGRRSPRNRPSRRVREAGVVCATGVSRASRQERPRRTVSEGLRLDRAGCERRPELCEERCQLGHPSGGQAQCRAERRVGHRG